MLKQKTLKDSFSLSGKGLHTGLDLTVTFNPAPDNHGYKIQRIDLEGQPTFDAVADNVSETTRGTVISKNGVKVSTVEHGMAALYALGIDNCLIQVNGPEFPILDGSAQYYVNEIERVGTVEQNAVKDFYIIKSKISNLYVFLFFICKRYMCLFKVLQHLCLLPVYGRYLYG